MKQTTKVKKAAATSRKRVNHAVKRAVVPHKKNQYRPMLVRRTGIALVLAVVFISQAGYNLSQSGSVLGQQNDVSRQQLLDDTNARRLEEGRAPLQLNAQLDEAATLKAHDMFAQQYWEHTAPNGDTPWVWFKKANYDYTYAGENLAKGFHSSAGVVTAWMNSPEHRQNLLDERYQDVGFAVVPGSLEGEDTMVVVALYGTLKQAGTLAATSVTPDARVLAAADGSTSLITRVGVGLQSMTPALLGSIMLLIFAAGVAVAAHAYRKRLPKSLQKGWKRHHGLYKAAGMTCIAVVLIALYGGGQI